MQVTIGLPFAENGLYLTEAIRSIFAQDYQDWKLILVADGASSEALAVARSVQDKRVVLVEHCDRRGLAVRLNEIAAHTTTDLLFRMDADDIMSPDRISRQTAYMQANSNIDVLGSHAYLIDEASRVRGAYVESTLPTKPEEYLQNGVFTHPTIVGRTKWFLANPYSENLARGQDKELWLRTFRTSTFGKLADRLLFYRVRSWIAPAARQLSSRYNKEIVSALGPSVIGPDETKRYLRAARAKDLIFRTAGSFAIANRRMYLRKIAPLGVDELDLAADLLASATTKPIDFGLSGGASK